MKALFTIVALVGGVFLYEYETHHAHASLGTRAIAGAIYVGVLLVIAAMAKSRDVKSGRPQGGSSYRRERGYPYR